MWQGKSHLNALERVGLSKKKKISIFKFWKPRKWRRLVFNQKL